MGKFTSFECRWEHIHGSINITPYKQYDWLFTLWHHCKFHWFSTLVAMKLHNMQHFDEYFNEFLHRLHTLSPELILEPKWKEIFISSLPLWVSQAIITKLPGKIGDYKFGVIRQAFFFRTTSNHHCF